MKKKSHKILDCKLVKIEKLYNQGKPNKLFYNLILENIDEPLLIETEYTLDLNVIGHEITYKLNAENEVSDFEIY